MLMDEAVVDYLAVRGRAEFFRGVFCRYSVKIYVWEKS